MDEVIVGNIVFRMHTFFTWHIQPNLCRTTTAKQVGFYWYLDGNREANSKVTLSIGAGAKDYATCYFNS